MQGNASKAAYGTNGTKPYTKYDKQLDNDAWRPIERLMPARHREWTGKAVLCSSQLKSKSTGLWHSQARDLDRLLAHFWPSHWVRLAGLDQGFTDDVDVDPSA